MTGATDQRDVALLMKGSRDGLREMAALLAATDPSALSAMRRSDDVTLILDGRPLVVCRGAAAATPMDENGISSLRDGLVGTMLQAAAEIRDFPATREEIFDLLVRTARLVAALAGEAALGIREVTVQVPAPWRRRTLVRADVDTSQNESAWPESDERLAGHAPDMPCMVDFTASDGFVEARGWSVHAMIPRSPPPDAMEILRESVSLRNRLHALAGGPQPEMDGREGALHMGGRTNTSEAA